VLRHRRQALEAAWAALSDMCADQEYLTDRDKLVILRDQLCMILTPT
jgi:hypothetical protein